MEKDIKALGSNQEKFREEMKNNKALKKEIKEDVVLVLGRKLEDKVDIMHEKQKELDDKMCAMTHNISTMAQNLSIMTHNHNTIMEMLQKLRSNTNHISNSDKLDHYVNKNESNKIDQDNKQDKETKYLRVSKIPIIYLIKMSSTKIIMRVKPVLLIIRTIQVRQIKYHRFIFYLNYSTTLEKPKCNTTW